MRYGLGISLLVIGAILAFAVADRISGVNLAMVGYICMGAGVLALIFGGISASRDASGGNTTTVVEHREPPADPR